MGAWTILFGYLVFIALDTALSHIVSKRYLAYMSAIILGNIIAIVNAYIFHKTITFKSAFYLRVEKVLLQDLTPITFWARPD